MGAYDLFRDLGGMNKKSPVFADRALMLTEKKLTLLCRHDPRVCGRFQSGDAYEYGRR